MQEDRDTIESVASDVVDSAVKIHSALGPGLLESAYQACLAHELARRGHNVSSEVLLPLEYEGLTIEKAYRIDMLVDDLVIVENKVVQNLLPIHQAQVFTYLKLTRLKLGLLINWNNRLIKHGMKRIVHSV
jgi:GxxExxY protein